MQESHKAHRAKQKWVSCALCSWKTRRVYDSEKGFGLCCNKNCNGPMKKILSQTALKRAAIYEEMRNET